MIEAKHRKKLIDLFENVDYRKIVSERVPCHPNTVYNVLVNGNSNALVETEILVLAKEVSEQKQKRKEAQGFLEQL